MSTLHLILDFETMGQDIRTCPVVNCAFYAFDYDRFTTDPYSFDELIKNIQQVKFDVEYQVDKYNYKIEEKAIQFWSSLPKEARKQIKRSDSDVTLEDFASTFLGYLNGKNIRRWWTRANTFDGPILDRIMSDIGMQEQYNVKLSPFKIRDIRTYIDAKFNFNITKTNFIPHDSEAEWTKMFVEHDSIHDVAADILRLQKIVRIENELE